jgi:hypothetical protein
MKYSEKLKDPRWISFSRDVKEHYNNKCSGCGCNENLHAHHRVYDFSRDIWEYDMLEMDCLCSTCHTIYHRNKDYLTSILMNSKLAYDYEFSVIILIVEALCQVATEELKDILDYVRDKNCGF